MSHHVAFLQSAFKHSATALDFANALAKRLYWLDDYYVQPFYSWAAPRLRNVAIDAFFGALLSLIDVALWLINTTRQFWPNGTHAIATDPHPITSAVVAHAHEAVSAFPTPAPRPLHSALTPVLALCPAVVPITFRQVQTLDSLNRWLNSALHPLLTSYTSEIGTQPGTLAAAIVPVMNGGTEAAPALTQPRRSTKSTGSSKSSRKSPQKRSAKSTAL